MDNKELALDYYIQSAEIRRNEAESEMEGESIIEKIQNLLLKKLPKEFKIPKASNNFNSPSKFNFNPDHN